MLFSGQRSHRAKRWQRGRTPDRRRFIFEALENRMLLYAVTVTVFPVRIYSPWMPFAQIGLIAACVSVIIVLVRAAYRGREGAAIALGGFGFMFLMIILGATDKRAPQGFAPIAIGLGLTLIHLVSIPVTNTSVNPARSTGVALFVGDWAVAQLWLFWLAPLVGGLLGAAIYRILGGAEN